MPHLTPNEPFQTSPARGGAGACTSAAMDRPGQPNNRAPLRRTGPDTGNKMHQPKAGDTIQRVLEESKVHRLGGLTEDLFAAYVEAKQKQNLFDYDDLLLLLRADDERPQLGRRDR
jgi:hypothetical protein